MLPSRAERHYSGLNVARDMQLVATDDGNSRDDLTADLAGLFVTGVTYVVISRYQLGARELLQNRNMKLIDCLIVNDAICHCDEGRVCSMTGVRWCSESWGAGQGTRTSVLLFPR